MFITPVAVASQPPPIAASLSTAPQDLIDKYGGTGSIRISKDGKSVNEFITLKYSIGRTYDKKEQRKRMYYR